MLKMIKRVFNNVRTKGMRQILKILLFITMLTPAVGFSQTFFEAMKALAEQGDASAQFKLAGMYDFGIGVPKNDTEAVKWYRLAAEQGDASAQTRLGEMHADGIGIPENDTEAVKWYRLAAEQGDATAQANLGFMYYNGFGVPQNYIIAYVLLSLSAAQGVEQVRVMRDIVATMLTPEQLATAQDIASRCFESGYKDCD